jgi:hypothetical protein
LGVREGEGERAEDCIEEPTESNYAQARAAPCWRDRALLDVFDESGRYLGDVAAPDHVGRVLHVDGNVVLTVAEDDTGTIMVKRYRLALPGEQDE